MVRVELFMSLFGRVVDLDNLQVGVVVGDRQTGKRAKPCVCARARARVCVCVCVVVSTPLVFCDFVDSRPP